MVKFYKHNRVPIVTGLVVFVASVLITHSLIEQRNHVFEDQEKRELTNAANLAKEKVQALLNQGLVATNTLSFIVQKYGVENNFEAIGEQILALNSEIDAIELVQGGVITHIYPIKGNESAIGYNILEDELRNKEAFRAIRQRNMFYAGPLELKQGGFAVVGRLPIYVEGKYWGFSAVIIKLETLIKAAGMENGKSRNYNFQLSKINPDTKQEEYFLSPKKRPDSLHTTKVNIAEGEWNIYVTSKNIPVFPYSIPMKILGFCLSLVLGIFSWYIARQPIKLQQLVDEKISELNNAEKELIESEAKFRTLVEQSLVGAFIMQGDRLLYVSPGFEILTGYPKAKLFNNMKLEDVIHPDDIQKAKYRYYPNHTISQNNTGSTLRIVRADGAIRQIEVAISSIVYKDSPAVIGTAFDVTEKMQEANLINEAVIDAQEKERLQIGMELHDNVQQILAASSLNLEVLKAHINNEKIAKEIIGNLKEYTTAAIQELRRLSQQLSPSLDPTIPFGNKVQALADNLGAYGKLQVNVTIDECELPLTEKMQLSLIRIIQEQLTNIIKHAKTSQVEIAVKKVDENVVLTIADRGIGFDTTLKKNGIGLENMRRRTEFMHGRLQIISAPGDGTKIFVQVPIKNPG